MMKKILAGAKPEGICGGRTAVWLFSKLMAKRGQIFEFTPPKAETLQNMFARNLVLKELEKKQQDNVRQKFIEDYLPAWKLGVKETHIVDGKIAEETESLADKLANRVFNALRNDGAALFVRFRSEDGDYDHAFGCFRDNGEVRIYDSSRCFEYPRYTYDYQNTRKTLSVRFKFYIEEIIAGGSYTEYFSLLLYEIIDSERLQKIFK